MSRTNIVATLGPACARGRTLCDLIEAGVDVFRLNFSHGTAAAHRRMVQLVRRAAERTGRDVSILGDLQGPKIRLGNLNPEPVQLRRGQMVTLTTAKRPAKGELPVGYAALSRVVKPGERMLIDDGRLELKIRQVDGPRVIAQVEQGGSVKSHKGINLPDTEFDESPLTAKDRRDVAAALSTLDLDILALSFVQRAEDVDELRALLAEQGHRLPIIAKIERHRALTDLTDILRTADGVMVARGDLGVEVPCEHVPRLQKSIIREANAQAKPVITATEMLESMITAHRPTRAEVTDVANAILDGTDALMLSAETAVGHDPVRVVEMMERIAEATEMGLPEGSRAPLATEKCEMTPWAICEAACQLARDLDVHGLVCLTLSGASARRLSRHRPHVPILALSPDLRTIRSLRLSWGVTPIHTPDLIPRRSQQSLDIEQAFERALRFLVKSGHLKEGQRTVCVAGVPFFEPGTTNLVAVREV